VRLVIDLEETWRTYGEIIRKVVKKFYILAPRKDPFRFLNYTIDSFTELLVYFSSSIFFESINVLLIPLAST